MNQILIKINPFIAILIAGFALGLVRYKSLADVYKGKSWLGIQETWNSFIGYSIAGLIGYYFFAIRWPVLASGGSLEAEDFFLLIFFALSSFGHMPILSKNITEGVEAIIKRFLEK